MNTSKNTNEPTTEVMPTVDRLPQAPLASRQKSKKAPRIAAIAIGVALLAGAAGFGGAFLQDELADKAIFTEARTDGNVGMTASEQDITGAVNKVNKSVVSIVTEVRSRTYLGTQVGEGAGTGIIVSKDGYVLTNKHVIDGASDMGVVTSDGTTYDNVTLIGTDPLNDVAFLKIGRVNDLPVAELGDSNSIRVAQEVIAIGNSLGQYQNTVTSGIISGKGRPVTAEAGDGGTETLTDLLQTDAAINPGNSGGPLINTSGQVIGINTAIAAEAQGIGFAIPVNATKGMLKSILKDGKAERAYLGVNYVAITPEVTKEYSLNVSEGAYVRGGEGSAAVVAGSPADKAGLRENDIILKVNDENVGENGGLGSLVAAYAPGETITLTIKRGNDTKTVEVTLSAYQA